MGQYTARHLVTEAILEELEELWGERPAALLTVAKANHLLWVTPSGCFRLTFAGYEILTERLSQPAFPFRMAPTSINIVRLSRRIIRPYYLDTPNQKIYLFGKPEASVASLYANFQDYLDNQVDMR